MADADSLIEAVAAHLRQAKTFGGDTLATALSGLSEVEMVAGDAAHANRIVGEMLDRVAAEAVAAVRRWEAENGWRCVPKEPTPEMMWTVERHHSLPTYSEDHRVSIYRAMVSASPTPPGSMEGQKE